MRVDSNQTYAAQLAAREVFASQNSMDPTPKSESGGKAAVTTAASTSSNNAVTGTTGSRLSAETVGYVMQATQESSTSNETSALRIAEKHGIEDMVNDPAYAAQRARQMGTYPEFVFITAEEFPKNGEPASVWQAFAKKTDARMAQVEQVHQQRSAYYDSLVEQGLSSVEIIAKLYEFNANLPESYADTVGFTHNNPNQSMAEWNMAARDYLEQAVAKANNENAHSNSSSDSAQTA